MGVRLKTSSKCSSTAKPRPHYTPKVQTLVLNILWMDYACSLKNKPVNKHAHVIFSPPNWFAFFCRKRKQVHK